MNLFHKRPIETTFIQHPVHKDLFTDFVTNLHELIYFPPFAVEKMEAEGITKPCKALDTMAVLAVKNMMYQFYHVPAVRHYFGDDLVHGIAVKITGDVISFENLDDTAESVQLTKEIVKTLEYIFINFLEKYDCYIFYQGDCFSFIQAADMKKLKKLHIEKRLVWVE